MRRTRALTTASSSRYGTAPGIATDAAMVRRRRRWSPAMTVHTGFNLMADRCPRRFARDCPASGGRIAAIAHATLQALPLTKANGCTGKSRRSCNNGGCAEGSSVSAALEAADQHKLPGIEA